MTSNTIILETVDLYQKLTQFGHHELASHLNDLDGDAAKSLTSQLLKIDILKTIDLFQKAEIANIPDSNDVHPIVPKNLKSFDLSDKIRVRSIGVHAIKERKVGAVILSGGQGTRLGFAGPKGMYDICLPSHKSIFQLHIEKLIRIKELCQASKYPTVYIMTSDLNDQVIRSYFRDNNYFQYPEDEIFFFEQGLQPCMSNDYKLILESESLLAKAPDGNGGIYLALLSSGAVEDMIARGIEHIHVYGIDNVLTKAIDPDFIGLCIDEKVQIANKVTWRASKKEKVGVTVQDSNNRMRVLEYSEIPSTLADASDESGKLIFGAANICNHYFSVSFLKDEILPRLSETYHVAKKKIPFYDTVSKQIIHPQSINGMKLEMFIFDVFPLASKWLVMEVDREDEFSPVKNEPGNLSDSPDTARYMITEQAKRWLVKAGAKLVDQAGRIVDLDARPFGCLKEDGLLCEISPLVSYEGENLEQYAGQVIVLPAYIHEGK